MKKIKNQKSKIKNCFSIVNILILFATFSFFSCNEHKVTSIEIFGQKVRFLDIGKKDTIEVKIHPLSSHIYNPVFWKSSDPNVAVVDSRGVVTAVYSGVCTITATAGDHRATCEIRVNTFELKGLEFTKAVADFYGNYYAENTNTAILTLYSAGYNIENDGSISGSGYYFRTEINYPAPNLLPPNGTFTNSENHQDFTFLQGKWTSDTTISGTYFASLGLYGASAIVIDRGSFNIENNLITGNFFGESGEKIEINYSGDIQFVDYTLPPPDTLKINDWTFGENSIIGENGNGAMVRRCKIYSENGSGAYLQIDFVVPLSASSIPIGFYRLNNSNLPYSLVMSNLDNQSGTILFENIVTPKEILYGNVNVEMVDGKLKFTIYLVEESGRVIFGTINNVRE